MQKKIGQVLGLVIIISSLVLTSCSKKDGQDQVDTKVKENKAQIVTDKQESKVTKDDRKEKNPKESKVNKEKEKKDSKVNKGEKNTLRVKEKESEPKKLADNSKNQTSKPSSSPSNKPSKANNNKVSKPVKPSSPKDTYTYKTVSTTSSIPFKTIDNYASSGGETKVVQEGREGSRERTFKVTYKNGVESSREEISSKVVKDPVNRIIARYVKIQDRKTETRTVEDKNDPIYEYSERDRWFVKTDLGIEYFYDEDEAYNRHRSLGKQGHLGNWGTAEPEVTETIIGYETKEETVVIQEEAWDWKY